LNCVKVFNPWKEIRSNSLIPIFYSGGLLFHSPIGSFMLFNSFVSYWYNISCIPLQFSKLGSQNSFLKEHVQISVNLKWEGIFYSQLLKPQLKLKSYIYRYPCRKFNFFLYISRGPVKKNLDKYPAALQA